MTSLVELIANVPTRELAPGEVLLTEGESQNDIHVLLMGTLTVERGGMTLATLDNPGTLVGEMSVLLGRPATATVRATRDARVRTLKDAAAALKTDAELASRIAAIVAARLDATSALLVDLNRENAGKPHEQSLLKRIFGALHKGGDLTADERTDLFGTEPGQWPKGAV